MNYLLLARNEDTEVNKNEIGIAGPFFINGFQYQRQIFNKFYVGMNVVYFIINQKEAIQHQKDFSIGPNLKYKIIRKSKYEIYSIISYSYKWEFDGEEYKSEYMENIRKDTLSGYKFDIGFGYGYRFNKNIKGVIEIGFDKHKVSGPGTQWTRYEDDPVWRIDSAGASSKGDAPGIGIGIFYEF
jgi:hypothetical protein